MYAPPPSKRINTTVRSLTLLVIVYDINRADDMLHILAQLPPEALMAVMLMPTGDDVSLRTVTARTSFDVQRTKNDSPLHPGVVYLAPAGYYTSVNPDATLSVTQPAENTPARWALNRLLESATARYRDRTIVVVMGDIPLEAQAALNITRTLGGTIIFVPEDLPDHDMRAAPHHYDVSHTSYTAKATPAKTPDDRLQPIPENDATQWAQLHQLADFVLPQQEVATIIQDHVEQIQDKKAFDETGGNDIYAPPGTHILLVEDDAQTRSYIQQLIGRYWAIEVAHDVASALTSIEQRRPDLVLADILLGDDTQSLIAQLRNDNPSHTIPVILFSKRDDASRVQGLAAGADDYLVPPFAPRELLLRISRQLEKARETALREEALREEALRTQQTLQEVVASISDGFMIINHDWRFIVVNRRAATLRGTTPEAMYGQVIWDLFPRMIDTPFGRRCRYAVRKHVPVQFEFLYPPWGIWLEYRIYPFNEGLIIFETNITKRKAAENAERAQRRRADALYNNAITLTNTLNQNEVIERIMQNIAYVVPATASSIALVQDDVVSMIRLRRNDQTLTTDVSFHLQEMPLLLHMVETGQPIIISNVYEDNLWIKGAKADSQYTSYLGVPIRFQAETLGFLNLMSEEEDYFSQQDAQLLMAFASQAAVAISNARLYTRMGEIAAFEERQRLARDLHDAVSQTLFTADVIAQALPDLWRGQPEDVESQLQTLRLLTRGALSEMRTLLLELRPEHLKKIDISERIRQLADSLRARKHITINLHVTDIDHLPSDVRIAIYRITQEALNNVIKHAHAQSVTILFDEVCESNPTDTEDDIQGDAQETTQNETRFIRLVVEDDGRGFDTDEIRDGMGLTNMRERAQSIGAIFNIISAPQQGTRVELSWHD